MNDANHAVAAIAAAIGDPSRARILYSLLDDRARTATELAAVAEIAASTASAHLNRLTRARLLELQRQGRHRYYRLAGAEVARALERLSVLAGASRPRSAAKAPDRLRAARTCYDHIAGVLGVALHDRLRRLEWLSSRYTVTSKGELAFEKLGIDLGRARQARRGFAFACLDWTERRSHLGGALGSEILRLALARSWVMRDADSRALAVTNRGRREMQACFGLDSQITSALASF
ncbi:MAG TPA: winged helix-turn-helix domain-containing protein [Bryobacteraceae bacterium]|jgi:DNA-binding transcriptional ArsR family regulator|nr:winged helix-turn-helix domain-containing protein [Bryobacteraceae bacterium]